MKNDHFKILKMNFFFGWKKSIIQFVNVEAEPSIQYWVLISWI
jgi:hypothetical protein